MSGFHCRIVGFQASESRFPISRNAGFRRPGHWCHESRNTQFRLIQVSENSKRLSESFKEAHSNIPWKAIYGFRNRIVHDYGHVDLSVVYATIKNDVPELIELLTKSL